MGFFDSSKSSTQTTSNTYDLSQDNSNIGASSESGAAVGIRGDNNAVTLTDQGAIGKAFDFGAQALDFSQRVTKQAQSNLMEGTSSMLDKITADSDERVNELAKYGILAAAAMGALFLYMKR